jgi:outer membrane protein TolC
MKAKENNPLTPFDKGELGMNSRPDMSGQALPDRDGLRPGNDNLVDKKNNPPTFGGPPFLRGIIFISLLFFISIRAQSVDSLINEALQNNPQLKSLQYKIKSAEYKSESVSSLPPPTLGLEFSQVPIKQPNPFTNAISQNLSFSQMFMLGGKLGSMSEMEKQNIPLAQNDYDIYKQKLIADVRAEYYKIWMFEHHAGLREDNINLLKDILSSVETSYKVNKAKYSDVLLVKAELVSFQTDLRVMNNNVSAEKYKMNNLLGRSIDNTDLEVQHEWKIDSLSYSTKELEDILLNNNPSIKKMSSMIKMNEYQSVSNNKELVPDLMVQGMLMRMPQGMLLTSKTDPMMITGNGQTEYMFSIMASVTLPFMPWSSGKITSKQEELNADLSGLSLERTNMQREMISQLDASIKNMENYKDQVQLFEKDVIPIYKTTFEAQLSEYRNNLLSINALLETLRTILMKEENLAEAKMNYQMTLADINMMAGIR